MNMIHTFKYLMCKFTAQKKNSVRPEKSKRVSSLEAVLKCHVNSLFLCIDVTVFLDSLIAYFRSEI